MENLINFNLLKEYDGTLKEVLKVWQKQKSYSVGDTVQYKGNYLKCTTAGTSGNTTLNFTGVEVGDTITDGTVEWEMIEPPSGSGNGLNDWKSNTQYKIDDIVVNDGQIYKALVEFISGSTFENIEILEDYTLQTGDTPIAWAEGTEINTNDIIEYNSNYYKALYNFTCGSTFTKNAFEEYVPKSLTDDDIDDIIDEFDVTLSKENGREIYSTEEQVIGKWIDGKTLYQKTYSVTSPNSENTTVIAHVPTGVTSNSVVYIMSSINSTNYPTIFNGFNVSSEYFCVFVRLNGDIVCRLVGSSYFNTPMYITIQYTKTS